MTDQPAPATMDSPDHIRLLLPASDVPDPEVTILVPALNEALTIGGLLAGRATTVTSSLTVNSVSDADRRNT